MTTGSENTFSKILVAEQASVATPAAGKQNIFIDSADHLLKRKDSSGTVTVVGTGVVDDTAYDATTWNGDTTHAPSKNAVRDKIESLSAGGRTLIQELTPTGTGTASFTSISGSYKKLTIEWMIRSTNGSNNCTVYMELNTDTTAGNYRSELQYSHATSAPAHSAAADRIIASSSANSSPANAFSQGIVEIPQYANTNFHKIATYNGAYRYDGTSIHLVNENCRLLWANTAAITQIDIKLSAGNFASNSVLRLYGES